MNYSIRIHRAVESVNESLLFVDGHLKVLAGFGINGLTSSVEHWIRNPNVYIIVAQDCEGQIVAGVKLHIKNEEFKIPLEEAIDYLDERVSVLVRKEMVNGTGEACGLWTSKSVSGKGLGKLLTRAAVAVAPSINLKSLFGFSSPYTLEMFQTLGYRRVESVGTNGDFYYPTPAYLSTVILIEDLNDLKFATNEDRNQIESLRSNQNQKVIESFNGKEIIIDYNLLVNFT
jgi:GNAT superfamily N-acetyltransferase